MCINRKDLRGTWYFWRRPGTGKFQAEEEMGAALKENLSEPEDGMCLPDAGRTIQRNQSCTAEYGKKDAWGIPDWFVDYDENVM
jgi:hypothetical protein